MYKIKRYWFAQYFQFTVYCVGQINIGGFTFKSFCRN